MWHCEAQNHTGEARAFKCWNQMTAHLGHRRNISAACFLRVEMVWPGRRQTSADGVLCLRWKLIASFFRGLLRTRLTAANYLRTVLAYAKSLPKHDNKLCKAIMWIHLCWKPFQTGGDSITNKVAVNLKIFFKCKLKKYQNCCLFWPKMPNYSYVYITQELMLGGFLGQSLPYFTYLYFWHRLSHWTWMSLMQFVQ